MGAVARADEDGVLCVCAVAGSPNEEGVSPACETAGGWEGEEGGGAFGPGTKKGVTCV